MVYEVIVGNVGTVYVGVDAKRATVEFEAYVSRSKLGSGRVEGESVTLLGDHEIIREYVGSGWGAA